MGTPHPPDTTRYGQDMPRAVRRRTFLCCVFQDYTMANTPETRAQMLAEETRPQGGKKKAPKARAPPVRRIIQGTCKYLPKHALRLSAVSYKARSNISQSTHCACPPYHTRYIQRNAQTGTLDDQCATSLSSPKQVLWLTTIPYNMDYKNLAKTKVIF